MAVRGDAASLRERLGRLPFQGLSLEQITGDAAPAETGLVPGRA